MTELSSRDSDNIQFELNDLDIPDLSNLFDSNDDIDFDNIESNADRQVSDKTNEVCCPQCEFTFKV